MRNDPTPAILLPSGTGLRQYVRTGPAPRGSVSVAIPARDETARIGACLNSLARAGVVSGLAVDIVILVNNSRDGTATAAAEYAKALGLAAHVFDVDLPARDANAGGARGLAMDIAARDIAPDAPLLTTDADSQVDANWLSANIAELNRGAALVGGLIEIDPAEAPLLSAEARAAVDAEGRYLDLMRRLEALIDFDPWNPWPHHGGMNGASMATRKGFYRRVGGLPRVAVSEDRELLARYRVHDLPAVHSCKARVLTSGRTQGRAPGGMADAVAARLADPDTPIDRWGEPARDWRDRLRARALARKLYSEGASLAPVFRALGIAPEIGVLIERLPTFGASWAAIKAASRLRHRRALRPSELPLESARLDQMILAATIIQSQSRDAVDAASTA